MNLKTTAVLPSVHTIATSGEHAVANHNDDNMIVVSVSGGKDSSAMLCRLAELGEDPDSLQEVEDLVEGKKHIRSLKEWLD